MALFSMNDDTPSTNRCDLNDIIVDYLEHTEQTMLTIDDGWEASFLTPTSSLGHGGPGFIFATDAKWEILFRKLLLELWEQRYSSFGLKIDRHTMTELRKERMLWLACRLARSSCFIYNPGSGRFYPPDSFHRDWGGGCLSHEHHRN
jgi:hypothetical protein